MNRREVLKYTALLTGSAISAPLITTLVSGCNSEATKVDDYIPKFFSKEEFDIVKDFVDVILPKTDSPSATAVGVHRMIDHMIATVYKEEDKIAYQEGFSALMNHFAPRTKDQGPDLHKIHKTSAAEKLEWLKKLDRSEDEALEMTRKAYLNFKQQTIAYYLSTEEIGKNYLTYLPVPGKYEACISLEEAGGKAWAL